MKFKELAELFQKIEETSSRNEMSKILSDFLKKCDSEDIQLISYIVQGRVAPMFVESEFNYSEKSLVKLLKELVEGEKLDVNVNKVRKESGDIGDTVEYITSQLSYKGGKCSIKEIYSSLWDIVNSRGTGSINRKNVIVLKCLKKLSPVESKFFTRTICGELRLGLNVRTLLDVFSLTLAGDKSLKKTLERAYGVTADIGYIARLCFEGGECQERLENVQAIPGTPILSRLVERVGSFEEVFDRFDGDIFVQPKFDGLRCQIHKWSETELKEKDLPLWHSYYDKGNGDSMDLFSTEKDTSEVRLFTRNLEDVTEMFPEIVESAKNIELDSFILDSEVVGWNYKKDTFLSYQETMQRRRKYQVGKKSGEIPVKAMIFDILYINGKDVGGIDTKERVEILKRSFGDTYRSITLAETKTVSDIEGLEEAFDESIEKGLEGIIVKQFEGGYKPGMRNFEWIKLKKSMNKALVDTIDMVVVGYYTGSGRRSKFGLGAILGAIYNKEKNTYDAISRVGTGMGDELLEEMYMKLSKSQLKKQDVNVRCPDILTPDVWVEPKYVISVESDEITRKITSSKDGIGAGLSLRFPRLIEFGRDKNPEDATTVKELQDMYKISKKKR